MKHLIGTLTPIVLTPPPAMNAADAQLQDQTYH
jgi:hypothetical protein